MFFGSIVRFSYKNVIKGHKNIKDKRKYNAEQWAKLRALFKVVKAIHNIDLFNNPCVLIKGLFQFKPLKHHMVSTGVDIQFKIRNIYKRIYLKNTKIIYKDEYLWWWEKNLNTLLKKKWFLIQKVNWHIPMKVTNSSIRNKPSKRKSLFQFSELLD